MCLFKSAEEDVNNAKRYTSSETFIVKRLYVND